MENEEERGRGREEAGRQCPRSCVAQRETFNSVTPGLNYHAETIVPGKIKKGARARLGGDVVPSQNHAQSCNRDVREREREYGRRRKGKGGGRGRQRRNLFFVCRTGCCARFNSTATRGKRDAGRGIRNKETGMRRAVKRWE